MTERHSEENRALREGVALLDRSERGKLALTGPDAADFLNGQVTNDVAALEPGCGCYAAFLTHKGKMLGDVRILSVEAPARALAACAEELGGESGDDSELWLDTERVAVQALFDLVRRFAIGYRVGLHKRTIERGLLSLIGPQARALANAERLPGREHANAPAIIAGMTVQLIVTSEGIDVLCAAQATAAVREHLLAAGAYPAGEPAVEALRVERGVPRYGIDMDESTIPEEAGLNERAVSFTKGCYVGQETVARLHWRGKPNRMLRGLLLTAPASPGQELRLDDRVVGRTGSCAVSPALGPVALALVRREAPPGSMLTLGDGPGQAQVVELPFALAG